jgi:hypothetical protein
MKAKLQKLAAIGASMALLLADGLFRVVNGLYRGIVPWLPSWGRLVAIGILLGATTVGGLIVSIQAGPLVPRGISWAQVGLVWGLALFTWAIVALAYLVLKTSSTVLAGIVYRLTDITQRPVVLPEAVSRTIAGPPTPEPAKGAVWRDPGKFAEEKGGSSFVPYSDDDALMREALEDMRKNGVAAEDIELMMEEFRQSQSKDGK